MNKQEEDKFVNAIIDLSQEIKGLRQDMEKQLAKVNLALGEMRLSYMKLDESFNNFRSDFNQLRSEFNLLRSDFNKYALRNDERAGNHEIRIAHLEEKTGGAYIASEPSSHYKGKKRK